jgi:hypothetical protein
MLHADRGLGTATAFFGWNPWNNAHDKVALVDAAKLR